MPKRTPTYKAILAEVARGSDRSSLFWWLVDHHDELVEQAAGKRMRWEPLCARFADHGLTDITGHPATPRTARETWFQARRAVAAARAQKAAADANGRPGDKYPSRISPDWRPQIVPPQAAIASARTSAAPPSLPPVSTPGSEVVRGPVDAVSDTPDFPTVDPSGAALEPGHVFFQGESMPRHMAEQLAGMLRHAKELDRFN
jgi:hypothetical protein